MPEKCHIISVFISLSLVVLYVIMCSILVMEDFLRLFTLVITMHLLTACDRHFDNVHFICLVTIRLIF